MSDEAPEHRPALPPVAYPLLGLVFGGILVWSFSRVLLAVKKEWAPVIALLMALNVLIGAAAGAYGVRGRRRASAFPLLSGGGGGGLLSRVFGCKPPPAPPRGAAGGPPRLGTPPVGPQEAHR